MKNTILDRILFIALILLGITTITLLCISIIVNPDTNAFLNGALLCTFVSSIISLVLQIRRRKAQK